MALSRRTQRVARYLSGVTLIAMAGLLVIFAVLLVRPDLARNVLMDAAPASAAPGVITTGPLYALLLLGALSL